MNINVSKEFIATLASASVILAFLLGIGFQMGEMRGAIEANKRAIDDLRDDVGELRDDMRELRSIVTSHLAAHSNTAAVDEESK